MPRVFALASGAEEPHRKVYVGTFCQSGARVRIGVPIPPAGEDAGWMSVRLGGRGPWLVIPAALTVAVAVWFGGRSVAPESGRSWSPGVRAIVPEEDPELIHAGFPMTIGS